MYSEESWGNRSRGYTCLFVLSLRGNEPSNTLLKATGGKQIRSFHLDLENGVRDVVYPNWFFDLGSWWKAKCCLINTINIRPAYAFCHKVAWPQPNVQANKQISKKATANATRVLNLIMIICGGSERREGAHIHQNSGRISGGFQHFAGAKWWWCQNFTHRIMFAIHDMIAILWPWHWKTQLMCKCLEICILRNEDNAVENISFMCKSKETQYETNHLIEILNHSNARSK